MTERESKKLGRRRFIRIVGGSAACLGAAGCLPHVEGDWQSCESSEPVTSMPESHKVVEVYSPDAVRLVDDKSVIDQGVVANMFRAGLLALTSRPTPAEAWDVVMPGRQAGQRISMKANALNASVPSSPQLLAAIADSLTWDYGVANEDVFVWDRTERELRQAGITTEAVGVACRGTVVSASDGSGPGYESEPVCLTGRKICLSRILTEESDHLINVAVLKNHFAAAFTGCLKNHYGSFENPHEFHEGCEQHIANLNAFSQITSVTRLNVVDALRVVTIGDTDKPADAEPGRILLAFDPVAADQRAMEIRDEIRVSRGMEAGSPAGYLQAAAGLGIGKTEYELEEITI